MHKRYNSMHFFSNIQHQDQEAESHQYSRIPPMLTPSHSPHKGNHILLPILLGRPLN